LELLVHELGHFFGAAHSPETNSVMRPLLADKQANSTRFRIGFDPLNALAMNLVTEEMGRLRFAAPPAGFADARPWLPYWELTSLPERRRG
jgi:hypothetical protein